MKSQIFHFPNELLSQITVLRKISATDRFPCFSCFDDKIEKLSCKVCVGSGFIYGSHPMVQFTQDFIEKKVQQLQNQEKAKNQMNQSNDISQIKTLSKSIDHEKSRMTEEQGKKSIKSKIENVSIDLEPNFSFFSHESKDLKGNGVEGRDWKTVSIECEDSNEEIIHYGYCCDECQQDPVIGCRYHCETCEDYDLCSKCFMKSEHEHEFVVFKQTEGAMKANSNTSHDSLLKSIRRSYSRKIE